MELYCTPKFNIKMLITTSSTSNTTGATSLLRSQITTNSSSIEFSIVNKTRYYGNQLLLEISTSTTRPLPLAGSQPIVFHHDCHPSTGHLNIPRSFRGRLTHPWWWRQYAPLKRRSTIIYTAVQPRRQLWTTTTACLHCCMTMDLAISHTT
jgi:hypothetical protein